MDKFSDRNDNDKNVNNWQQKNNNNVENCVNNEIDGANRQKSLIVINGESNLHLVDQDNRQANDCCIDFIVRDIDRCEEVNQGDEMSNKTDSTENLSFLNENDFFDDLIPLQDYVISDDEVSNPDNCVYAYRGSVSESPEPLRPQVPQDDETDFLEMDFEPEPNSEADASSFMEINTALNQPSASLSIIIKKSEDPSPPDKIKFNDKEKINIAKDNDEKQQCSPQSSKNFIVKENIFIPLTNSSSMPMSENVLNSGPIKATGAIPKRTSSINKILSSPSSSSLASLQTQNINAATNKSSSKSRNRDQDKTIDDVTCHSEIRSFRTNDIKPEKFDGNSVIHGLENVKITMLPKNFANNKNSKIDTLKIFDKNQAEFLEQVTFVIQTWLNILLNLIILFLDLQLNTKNSVNFSSANCDEQIVINALVSL